MPRGGLSCCNCENIEQTILANGRVDGPELEALRGQLYAGGKIERREADFLVELHKRVQHRTPAFEHFFYQAIKDHILAHGRIDAEETAWLRRMLFADGKIDDEEAQVPARAQGRGQGSQPEFEALFEESMKQSRPSNTLAADEPRRSKMRIVSIQATMVRPHG